MNKIISCLITILLISYSCTNKNKKPVIRDTSINKTTSFNNLFFDSIDIDNFFVNHTNFLKYAEHFHDFYKERNYEFAWFDTSGLAEQAYNFFNLLNSSISELQDSSLLNKNMFTSYAHFYKLSKNSINKNEAIKAELLLTGQFFDYAARVYKGIDFDATELGWFIPRKKLNLSQLLDSVILSKAVKSEVYVPFNSQYKKLQEKLQYYFKLQHNYPKDTIAYLKNSFVIGDKDSIIFNIKSKLCFLKDLEVNDSSTVFDSTLLFAISKFQNRFGLTNSKTINNKFIEELNVPIKSRIKTLLINIERARWLPPENDSNYFLVNIPEYKLHVYDSGINVWDMNVIVGKTATNTVIFNGKLRYIVFSPYWNVPNNIITNELMPALKKDKNYLEKNNMEFYGGDKNSKLIRQKPGPKNSLGLVKFLFPNNYDIYFHDTPNRNLFSSTNRSFSHGCIRLGEPKKLAEYLLRYDTSYTSLKIDSLMNLPKDKWVGLEKPVPVFIVYFTSWVDNYGNLNFRKDIYEHDKKMNEKLFTK